MKSFDDVVTLVDMELADVTRLDPTIPRFDFTKVNAIHTCPTWGILRYDMHKVMPGGGMGRTLSLDAGSLSHEVYSAIRLYELSEVQHEPDAARVRGLALFNEQRWDEIISQWKRPNSPTGHLNTTVAAVIATSDYYDDPRDTRRTLTNIETACLAYVGHWEIGRYPVYLDGTVLGVEVPFAILITFATTDGAIHKAYYVGSIDGLHTDPRHDRCVVMENKTGSRIDDVWRMSFATSHQVTGYMLAGQLMTQQAVAGMIIGMQIPMPKVYADGIVWQPVTRLQDQYNQWVRWLWHAVEVLAAYKNKPKEAPKFTHSCSRYFRACSFIPFCADDGTGQDYTLAQMDTDEWNVLAEKHGIE